MSSERFKGLKALYINCSLKRSPEESHTQKLLEVSSAIMKREGVAVDELRLIDEQLPQGIYPDMTEHGYPSDPWPDLFQRFLAADILIIGTPIWLGEPSSEARKLIERLYAMSARRNDKGQSIFYGKTGACVITGNEDGAKHCAMSLLYSLQHLGYSIPPQADCGWLGEIGPGPSYGDEDGVGYDNEFTNRNTTFMTYNCLHLAQMLKAQGGYDNYGNNREEWDDGTRWNFENPEYR